MRSCNPYDRVQMLQEYVDLVVLRDVAERHNATNIPVIRELAAALFAANAGAFSVSRLHGSLTTQGWKVGKATLLAFLGHLVDAFLVFLVPMRTRAADAGRIRIVPAREWFYDARRFLWSRRGRGPRPVNRRDHPGSDTQAPGRGPRTFSADSNRIWRKCPPMGACRGPFGHYSSELRSVAAPRGQIRLFPVLLADIFSEFKSNLAKMSAGAAASPPTATPQPATAWSLRAP